MAMKRTFVTATAWLIAVFVCAGCAVANPSFDVWLAEFRKDALTQGISQQTLDAAFDGVRPIARVIELDRKQPETTMTLGQYLDRIVSDARIDQGRQMFAEHRELLSRVSSEYGVQPEYIVALWGIETNFGKNTGGFTTVAALATLAHEGRRSDFFRKELINILRISQEEGIPPQDIKGSWAGALGQCQFMPSSFLSYAVDYNKDGKRDIWDTQEDVFASIANYLSRSGWEEGLGWGFAVDMPDGFDRTLANIKESKPLSDWKKMDLKPSAGDWPAQPDSLSLVLIGEGDEATSYLVSKNYKTILLWNRSRYFATAVGMLAERIANRQ